MNKKIYILHGWAYDTSKWEKLLKHLAEFGFETKLLKIPGLTEKSGKVWDLKKYSDWLFNSIKEEKAVLLGHSNGGRIALFFAAAYPEKVSKLILVDSAGIYRRDWAITFKRSIFGTAAKIGKTVANLELFRKIIYKLARENDYANAPQNMKKTMINMIESDVVPILPNIKCPVIIIWGKDDKVTPLSDGVKIHRLIKGSKLRVIAKARHSPFYTHPGQVADIISNDF